MENPEAFLTRFDTRLGEFNDQYRLVRQDAVPPPRLRLLAPGSFTVVKRRLLQRGTSESQLKLPHLSEDRNFLNGVTVEQEQRLPVDLPV